MKQRSFHAMDGSERTAYEMTPDEFRVVTDNLALYGHAGKRAITLSNNIFYGVRPKPSVTPEAVEVLTAVFTERLRVEESGDLAAPSIELSDFDKLRAERAEVVHARLHPKESGLDTPEDEATPEDVFDKHNVLVGLATVASAFNELRPPLIEGSGHLLAPDQLNAMMHQFHAEGVERIMSRQ